jgi:hypothetical protein
MGHLGLVEVSSNLNLEFNKRSRQGSSGVSQADLTLQTRAQYNENEN